MNEQSKTDNKTITSINAKFKKALSDFRFIGQRPYPHWAFDGGKDSLALVELLGNRMKVLFLVLRWRILFLTYTFLSKTLVLISYLWIYYLSKTDCILAIQNCFSGNIKVLASISKNEITSASHFSKLLPTLLKKSFCFLCSWQRRKQIYSKHAIENIKLNCNKIALLKSQGSPFGRRITFNHLKHCLWILYFRLFRFDASCTKSTKSG